jgi:hypothetical protein
MAPINELRPLLAWGGLAKLLRVAYSAAAKAGRYLWPPANTLIAAQRGAVIGFVACVAIGSDLFGADFLLAARLPSGLSVMAPLIHIGLAAGWFFIGIAILKYSKLGAGIALAAYLATAALAIFTNDRAIHATALATTIVLILLLVRASQSVFAYHRIEHRTEHSPHPGRA